MCPPTKTPTSAVKRERESSNDNTLLEEIIQRSKTYFIARILKRVVCTEERVNEVEMETFES